ncbi:hypothetical protein ACFQHO_45005 [Actinomadura yumaensis]|uniref:hypothetical protein n=1 Tax=Actinomadura TaxID=1988 RepID=UPI0013234FFE|nr:hypothetical protein [Actinomadura sp. J1-007]MWK39598.1 hypothetical protein [Actinomadura sp. J1-007]
MLVLLCCDASEAAGTCGAQIITAHTDATAARAWAQRAEGWTRDGDDDRCPRHSRPHGRPAVHPFDTDPHT